FDHQYVIGHLALVFGSCAHDGTVSMRTEHAGRSRHPRGAIDGRAHITYVHSAAPAQRLSVARSLRATRRLATFAVARLGRRRGLAILSASGAALSVAMLTAVLIVGTGVEDQAFN